MKLEKSAFFGKPFAKLGDDFEEGDIIKIADEGQEKEGEFGTQLVFSIEIPAGEQKVISLNKTSKNKLIDAYGDDTANWVDKEAKVWVLTQNVGGKMKKVVYLTAPDQQLEDE